MTLRTMSLPTTLAGERMIHRVLILGAAYGGLATGLSLLHLLEGNPHPLGHQDTARPASGKVKGDVRITFIDERDGFLHTIGTPLAHTSRAYTPKAWKTFDTIPWLKRPNVHVKRGTVKSVNIDSRIATYTDTATGNDCIEHYDFLVAATGLHRKWPIVPQGLTMEEYLHDALDYVNTIAHAGDHTIAVVGGGAVGVEFAAELKDIHPNLDVRLIHSRSQLLPSEPLPDEFKRRVLTALQEAGVKTILDRRVVAYEKPFMSDDADPARTLILSDGSRVPVALALNCATKFSPNTGFLPGKVLDEDGYLPVTRSMSFPLPSSSPTSSSSAESNIPRHYGIGDIANPTPYPDPLIKRCGLAIYTGRLVAGNIHECLLALESSPSGPSVPQLESLPEFAPAMGVALGRVAAGYDEKNGAVVSEKCRETLFGDDLALTVCSTILSLDLDLDSPSTKSNAEPAQSPSSPQSKENNVATETDTVPPAPEPIPVAEAVKA